MEHVVIFEPKHLSARDGRPRVSVAVEARDRPGPAYKQGVFDGDVVWIRMGPLLIAKSTVKIAWKGEYAMLRDIRERTRNTELYRNDAYWAGKPRVGYAIVAQLQNARFLPKAELAGPRTYGYDWIVLESETKHETWLHTKPPEDKDAALVARFEELKKS